MKKVRTDLAALSFFVFGLVGSHMAHAQSKRGVTPEDYFSFKFISDPHISPDGKAVVSTRRRTTANPPLVVVPIDGSLTPRRLSAEGFNSNSPRWSPDGKTLAVISTRSTESSATDPPKRQIYLLPKAVGREAMPLTKLKNGVQSYQWSPEGSRIVLVSSSGPVDNVAPANRKSDVRHYSHIDYKFNDTGWFDDKRRHLWVVNVPGGDAKQITGGQDWNDTDPQWSPDGSRIAFVSDRTGKNF